jgi:hypothetical protein
VTTTSEQTQAMSTVSHFEKLLGSDAWMALPPEIRTRFDRQLSGSDSMVYQGHIIETRLNIWGRLLAIVLIPFGAPLPMSTKTNGQAAVVAVTDDGTDHGHFWTRIYGANKALPQVIQSSKDFVGPTGIEERMGAGLGRFIGMSLTLEAEPDALHFVSESYFLALFGRRFWFPAWLRPGRMVVTHRAIDRQNFTFQFSLTHKWLGELNAQTCMFHDMRAA